MNRLRFDGVAPLGVDPVDGRPASFGDIDHPVSDLRQESEAFSEAHERLDQLLAANQSIEKPDKAEER
jgi:hypothetical protein